MELLVGVGHFGSKEYVDQQLQKAESAKQQGLSMIEVPLDAPIDQIAGLQKQIVDLEKQLSNQVPQVLEIIKEVIKEIPVEVIKEVPVEVVREVRVIEERIVEKEVQVIKEVPVYKKRVMTEFIDRPIEVIKEVEKEVVREVKIIPWWAYAALVVEALAIIVLLLK